MREVRLDAQRLFLAGLEWGNPQGSIVLALHGWLDNAASFVPLAECLDLRHRRLIAIDLPGHGLSDHRPPGDNYHFMDYVQDVVALIESFEQPVCLVGHSLGGAIASVVAAVVPARISRLILLDALGPIAAKEEQTLANLRHAMDYAARTRQHKVRPIASIEQAVRIRMTGMTALKPAAAQLLVERSLIAIEGGFTWRSAVKLKAPSASRLTEGQIRNLFEGICAPVCLVVAKDGLFGSDKAPHQRLSYIKRLTLHWVAGGHHFHMEANVVALAALMDAFMDNDQAVAGNP